VCTDAIGDVVEIDAGPFCEIRGVRSRVRSISFSNARSTNDSSCAILLRGAHCIVTKCALARTRRARCELATVSFRRVAIENYRRAN